MKLQDPARNIYALLFTAVILLVLGGEANIQVHKPAVLHGSVTLTYSPSHKMETVTFIAWKYNNGERITILDTTRKPYFLYPSQFRNRLLISDDLFTLIIKDLTMAYSGMYSIEVIDINGRLQSSSFTVTVYEPIHNASIRTEVKENTSDRCNVTLHCSAPSYTSAFSYTWKYKHRDSGYRMYNNMSFIQISVPRDHQDMELLCIVHNPADQKNVSVRVQEMCNFPGGEANSQVHKLVIVFCRLRSKNYVMSRWLQETSREPQVGEVRVYILQYEYHWYIYPTQENTQETQKINLKKALLKKWQLSQRLQRQ
ncbi:T-lymphocyte surface antigen Ly-9-like [Leptodactylus fuscus]|uniref:T-lymphocyte surface antigen Ly-9-like n=1 Tax=Leptodactylus fuscus TaxID=238119 RepID=UPI003F4E820C